MTEEQKTLDDALASQFTDKIDPRAIKYVDTREKGSAQHTDTLRMRLTQIGWFPKYLRSGDFYFLTHDYKKLGISRKTTDDLINSIGEHWSKQLDEMLDFYDIRKILIEGSWNKIKPSYIIGHGGVSHLTWDNVWDFLDRWQDKGFAIELTVSEEHTMHRLNRLYAIYQRPYSLTGNTREHTDDRVLAFPSGCRGKTAQQILDDGKSLADIAGLSPEQLQNYQKIGDKKAHLIHDHFHKRTGHGKEYANG